MQQTEAFFQFKKRKRSRENERSALRLSFFLRKNIGASFFMKIIFEGEEAVNKR
jgi:hypothetical protein